MNTSSGFRISWCKTSALFGTTSAIFFSKMRADNIGISSTGCQAEVKLGIK